MKTNNVQAGDRLDQIVYKEYGTLDVFAQVLAANPQLKSRTILNDTDVINLPVIEISPGKEKEVKSLW
ncbi:tail protein X [Poseidonibacter lekithochrous]|uniref:tail protein X n=1 Tax=Poseidonibacter lekithochrous TaxID=1904463 RepID=UPI000D39923C|nr:tail protein X [Poseidonibacter lekithochrous]